MVYEVPPSKGAAKSGKWEFKVGAKKFEVPKMRHLTPEALVKIASVFERVTSEGEDSLPALTEIPDLFGEKAADAVRGLDGSQRFDLLTAWAEDSGMTAGESSASADS